MPGVFFCTKGKKRWKKGFCPSVASLFSVNRALKMTLGVGVAVTGGPAGAQTDFTALCKAVAELPVKSRT